MAFILSQIVDCGKDKAAGVSFTWSTSRQNTEKKSMFENENWIDLIKTIVKQTK